MTYGASTLDVRPLSGLMKALGDDTRLRIVALLSHGELCVCHIAAALDLGQPNTSQHLSVLRNAGVVDSRRHANWVHYRLLDQTDPIRSRVLDALTSSYVQLEFLAEDVRRLTTAQATVSCG